MTDTSTVDTVEDFGRDPGALARRWAQEIKTAQKELHNWHEDARDVVARYVGDTEGEMEKNWYNILWSNTQTMLPALYAKSPVPLVSRRWGDKDPVARVSAEILERSLLACMDLYDYDGPSRAAVLDFVLTGFGQKWVVYEPRFDRGPARVSLLEGEGQYFSESGEPVDFAAVQMDESGPYIDGPEEEYLAGEEVRERYINWSDFLMSPARTWAEVRWVAKREYLTREKLVERFGDIGAQVPLDQCPDELKEKQGPEYEVFKKAVVWEIWDKDSRTALWLAPSFKEQVLDERPDPLGLRNFFPCPKPLIGTTSNDRLVPTPDYCQYKTQAREIDQLTKRIKKLIEAVKVVGVYAGEARSELDSILSTGKDNVLIPVPSWAMHAQNGGLRGQIDWFPIDQVVSVLVSLVDAREQLKRDIYELTGISDIVRGQDTGGGKKTATEQNIKRQFATLRLGDRQSEVQRFLRDCLEIKAEIIAEHFSDETLVQMSGIELTLEDPSIIPQAIAMMRDDVTRSYRIDIETDSTLEQDPGQEQAARVEFMGMVGGFFDRMGPMMQQGMSFEVMKEMLMWTVRGFRAGRDLEAAIEQLEPPQPQPDADQMQAQQDMQRQMAEMQLKQGEMQLKLREIAIKEAELKLKADDQAADQTVDATKLEYEEQRLEDERNEAEAKIAIEAYKAGMNGNQARSPQGPA